MSVYGMRLQISHNLLCNKLLICPLLFPGQGQNQHFHNQNQSHPSQQQAQSKDMPPRFIKKGQLNADEVRAGGIRYTAASGSVPSDYKKTRYSEESPLLAVLWLFLSSSTGLPLAQSVCFFCLSIYNSQQVR